MESHSSKLLSNAVEQFATLPGIGRKTALRLTLFMLKQEKEEVALFADALLRLKAEIRYCSVCCNISDTDLCELCANPKRDKTKICVVENLQDVIAIENTQQFNGGFHVLGGVVSPMDGIGPEDLNITQLIDRIQQDQVEEVIMALSSTMEGDTTNFYLFKRLKPFNITVTTIARGMAIGDEIEYTDEVTLGKSILNRIPYINSLAG
jgi:recombination protein RecR